MKKALLIALVFLLNSQLNAQTIPAKAIPISIGYFANFGYQPGLKVSTRFDLKNLGSQLTEDTPQKSLFVSPQVGFYTWQNRHTSFLVNAEAGYQRLRTDKPKYSTFSIGLGYLNQSQITDFRVSLNDGSKEKIRENWSWFLPTLNYEFGRVPTERMGWYGKLSYGYKMAANRANASLLLVEAGITFNLNNK